MPETPTPPSSTEKNVVVNNCQLCRLWTLTIASLTLNVLILLLLMVGAIIHHHHKHHPGFGNGARFERQHQMDSGQRFHNFGGPGMPGMMGKNKNGPPDPAKVTDGILNHLSEKLTLTDDQKAKIKPIIEQQVTEIQKQLEAQRQEIQKQIEDTKAKIKPLLTPDQQKQLDAMPLPGQKPPVPDEAKQPAPKPGQ